MTNVLIDGVLLSAVSFFVSVDIDSGEGWSDSVLLQLLIAAALLALLLGDLGLVHGL